MKQAILTITCFLVTVSLTAQDTTHPLAYAYIRRTQSGIPQMRSARSSGTSPNRNPFPDSFYLYVRVPSGTRLSIDGIWLNGQYFTANLQPMNSPALVNHDNLQPGKIRQDTLVRNDSGTLYRIIPGEMRLAPPGNKAEEELKDKNQAVFLLHCDGSPCPAAVQRIRPLRPYSAM